MKTKHGIFVVLLLAVSPAFLLMAGAKQESSQSGSAGPITLTTARTTDPTSKFFENNPDIRSDRENRWITTYKTENGKFTKNLLLKWRRKNG
jgi:hypothetical protein